MQHASSTLQGKQRSCAPFSCGKQCFRSRFAPARDVAAQAAADPLLLRVARGEGEGGVDRAGAAAAAAHRNLNT
jgi:hypothetical protein